MLYQEKKTHTKIRLRECKSKLPDHGTDVFNWNQIQEQDVFFRVGQVCWAVWQFIFFLSSWAGSILQILQSDWFWEWAVFLPSGPLTAGGIRKNVSKFSWKPFKSLFNIITQINMFWWNFSLSFALPLFSLLSTRSQIVPFMENLALITALYPSDSFRKKIKMLFTSQGQSVLGKTVPSVLCTKTSGTIFFPIQTDFGWWITYITFGQLKYLSPAPKSRKMHLFSKFQNLLLLKTLKQYFHISNT